jgi:hypothetical protein
MQRDAYQDNGDGARFSTIIGFLFLLAGIFLLNIKRAFWYGFLSAERIDYGEFPSGAFPEGFR